MSEGMTKHAAEARYGKKLILEVFAYLWGNPWHRRYADETLWLPGYQVDKLDAEIAEREWDVLHEHRQVGR